MEIWLKYVKDPSYWAKKFILILICVNCLQIKNYEVQRCIDSQCLLRESKIYILAMVIYFAALIWHLYEESLIIKEVIAELIVEIRELKDLSEDKKL